MCLQKIFFHQIQPTIMEKYIKQEMPDIQQTGEKTLQIGARRSCPYSSFTLHQRRTSETSLGYLEKHGGMKVTNYMEMTGLSRTAATLELQEFRRDTTSSIDFIGREVRKCMLRECDTKL